MASDSQLAMMLRRPIYMNLQPGRLEAIGGFGTLGVDSSDLETGVAQANSLVAAGGFVIQSEHDVE